MSATPLMPKATAVWLLENTTLTFDQIGIFCDLHVLEIQALADGEIPIMGMDPVAAGQLTIEEIQLSEKDSKRPLSLKRNTSTFDRRTSGPRYTPLNKRQDKPDAVSWLIRNYVDLTDNQIIKLVGTTKQTIEKIKNRSHWNIQNIRPRSPVDLGICTQKELDSLVNKSKGEKEHKPARPKPAKSSAVKKPSSQKKSAVKKASPKKVVAKKTPVKKKSVVAKKTKPKKTSAVKTVKKVVKSAAKKSTPKSTTNKTPKPVKKSK